MSIYSPAERDVSMVELAPTVLKIVEIPGYVLHAPLYAEVREEAGIVIAKCLVPSVVGSRPYEGEGSTFQEAANFLAMRVSIVYEGLKQMDQKHRLDNIGANLEFMYFSAIFEIKK